MQENIPVTTEQSQLKLIPIRTPHGIFCTEISLQTSINARGNWTKNSQQHRVIRERIQNPKLKRANNYCLYNIAKCSRDLSSVHILMKTND